MLFNVPTKKKEIAISDLDRALEKLERLRPQVKLQFLQACATCVVHDQKIAAVEVELLRAFSDVLGCPVPPVVLRIEQT